MRGKDAGCLVHHEKHRITPACAGKSASNVNFTFWSRDHPRVCGEKLPLSRTATAPSGSPPRMRGKERLLPEKHTSSGITPACAGKSSTATRAARSTGDHPRVCGEKTARVLGGYKPAGSPPRMRGKGGDGGMGQHHHRITPACAGKSTVLGRIIAIGWDHPRVCGEKPALAAMVSYLVGSPRVCGEKKKGGSPEKSGLGSPPRMRGKVTKLNTNSQGGKDHPRVCGEKFHGLACRVCPAGSPPRMRGKVEV